jgi:hypothetical protein
MLIPFRLIRKQYFVEVDYSASGRWNNAVKKEDAPVSIQAASEEQASNISKTTAALYFCDAVYGIKGDALFCETDGYTYEMGLYEYKRNDNEKTISILKEGEVVVPERLEARIFSILREAEKTIPDLYCVGVYGNLNPTTIKVINDIFPEAIRIFQLNSDDLLKGAALYLEAYIPEGGKTVHEV